MRVTRKVVIRILTGILLMAAGVLLLITIYKPEMTALKRLLVSGAFASFAFGGLAAIFGGWRGFALGACFGISFAVLVGVDEVFVQPASGIITIAMLALMAFSPILVVRLGRRKHQSAADLPEETEEPLTMEESEALLLRNGVWVSQYLRDGDKIYTARLLSTADPEERKLILRSADDYTPARGNSILRVSNIAGVQRRKSADAVYIRLRRRDKGFAPWYEVMCDYRSEADKQIAKVFEGIPIEQTADKLRKQNALARAFFRLFPNLRKEARERKIRLQREGTAEGQIIIRRYDKLYKVMLIISVACQVLWLYVDVDYALFCVVNLILPPISFVLYFYRLRAGRTADKNKDETKLVFAMLLSSLALLLRASIDYSLDDQSQLLVPMVIITAVFALLLRLMTFGTKPVASWMVIALTCILICYAPAASVHVNWMLDNGKNDVETVATITEMDIEIGSRSPTHYELTLQMPDGEKDVDVSKDFYHALKVGDEVLLVVSTGPLGITYSDAYPMK